MLFYNKERQSCALQCKHANNWHQSGALRRAISWINARYSQSDTQSVHLKMRACSMTDRVTLFNHPSTANTIKQIIEHIHKAHSSNPVDADRQPTTNQTSPQWVCSLSLSLSHAPCTQSLQLLQLHAEAGAHTRTVAHTHLMHTISSIINIQ